METWCFKGYCGRREWVVGWKLELELVLLSGIYSAIRPGDTTPPFKQVVTIWKGCGAFVAGALQQNWHRQQHPRAGHTISSMSSRCSRFVTAAPSIARAAATGSLPVVAIADDADAFMIAGLSVFKRS